MIITYNRVASYWDGGQTADCIDASQVKKGQAMEGDLSPQINARAGTGGNNLPLVMRADGRNKYTESEVAGTVRKENRKHADTDLVASYWDGGQTADCIDSSSVRHRHMMPERRRFPAVLEPTAFTQNQQGDLLTGQVAPSMGTNQNATGRNTPKVCFDTTQVTSPGNYSHPKEGNPCHPLAAGQHPPAIGDQMTVRRLTPRECERLQGMEDDYTRIPWRGKPAEQCPDGPRYAAIGNSIAVPVLRWIGERIELIEEIKHGAIPAVQSAG